MKNKMVAFAVVGALFFAAAGLAGCSKQTAQTASASAVETATASQAQMTSKSGIQTEEAASAAVTYQVVVGIDPESTGTGTLYQVDEAGDQTELTDGTVIEVPDGQSITIGWMPDEGCSLLSLLVNGEDKASDANEIVIGPVQQPTSVIAAFGLNDAAGKEAGSNGVYVGDFVDSMTSMLDAKDIAYEVGSKMGGNEKADFEKGIYGYPFFQGESFYVIAMTDDNENVETVDCTLNVDDAFSEDNLVVMECSIRAFAANLTDEEIQQAVEKIASGKGSATVGNVQISATTYDSSFAVEITWTAAG